MDEKKLYANIKLNLENLLKIVEIFPKDIKMQFAIDKRQTWNVCKGKYSSWESFAIAKGNQITPLLRNECHKYLHLEFHSDRRQI